MTALRIDFSRPLEVDLPPMSETHVSVVADVGPSEMTCAECRGLMVPFRVWATLRGHVGLSIWECWGCWRQVHVRWAAEGVL